MLSQNTLTRMSWKICAQLGTLLEAMTIGKISIRHVELTLLLRLSGHLKTDNSIPDFKNAPVYHPKMYYAQKGDTLYQIDISMSNSTSSRQVFSEMWNIALELKALSISLKGAASLKLGGHESSQARTEDFSKIHDYLYWCYTEVRVWLGGKHQKCSKNSPNVTIVCKCIHT